MYNKPSTEVTDLKTVRLMDSLSVSNGEVTDPSSPPDVGAPKRGDIIY